MTAQKSSQLNDDDWINIITSSECYISKCFNIHHALYIMSFAAAWWVCLSWGLHDAIVPFTSPFMPERECNTPIRMLNAQVLLRRATGPRLYTQHDLASNTHTTYHVQDLPKCSVPIDIQLRSSMIALRVSRECSQMVCCQKACISISGLGQLGQLASL